MLNKMTDAQYGKRRRQHESFTRSVMRQIKGKDKSLHNVTVQRKAGEGVGNFADVTGPLTVNQRGYIRERARRTTREAIQREWILNLGAGAIKKRIEGAK